METIVRRLEPEDAQTAASVVRQFAQKDVAVAYMERFLSNPANYLVVAEADGKPVGFLLAHALDRLKEDARKMFIYEIEVAEENRRKGIGAALISHIRSVANQENMLSSFVFTNHSNTGAVEFYKSTGAKAGDGDDLLFVYDG